MSSSRVLSSSRQGRGRAGSDCDVCAIWATRQGLLATPGQEALYCDGMETAAASGDPQRHACGLPGRPAGAARHRPLDELADETVALYEHLVSRLERRGA